MKYSTFFVTTLIGVALYGSGAAVIAQTTPPVIGSATGLPNVVVETPKHFARHKPVSRAVVRRTDFARSSRASLNEPPVYGRDTLATTTGNCSTTTDFVPSPVQCTKPTAHSYTECTEAVAKNGGRPMEAWWWCTNQKFKN